MIQTLHWNDIEELALALAARFPETDPLTVRFMDLHRWVCELPEFRDDPKASNEKRLEAIQMAWLEEYQGGPDERD
jgi:FeS assembly protein IscX